MKNIFFRTTSLWASVLYMALGLVLTFWPGMSGTVFCWGIAAALILYAAHSFWYFIKARNLGFTAGGTLVIGILCLAFGIFCFSRPYVVLSFLPIALGIMLLVDGIGKMPLAVDALSVYSPYRFWVLISAVLPLILGIVLLVNPFRAAKAAIMFFGISILADGLFELITYTAAPRRKIRVQGHPLNNLFAITGNIYRMTERTSRRRASHNCNKRSTVSLCGTVLLF